MAFGPATANIQQAVLALLEGRSPSPLAPVPLAPTGGIGPLDMETTAALAALQPQPVPAPLPGPVDADAIRSRFAGMAGPEPVAPVAEPTPLIIRVARALQGFGAGVQGQGPQFLANLQEQTERPQREFQARKERFDTRKQELGVMAEQAVMSAEDRRMARTMQLIDKQADRDFEETLSRGKIKGAEAVARMKEAFDLERDAKKAELERQERERKDAKERKDRVDNIAKELFDDLKISRQQARAFAEFEVNQTPLSQADAKVYNRLEKFRRPVGGAGGAAQPKVMAEIANPDGSTSVVPFTAQVGDAIKGEAIKMGPRGVFMQGQQPQVTPAAAPATSILGDLFAGPAPQIGQQQQAKPGTVFTRAEVEAHAKRTRRDPKAVEAAIRARGGVVQ